MNGRPMAFVLLLACAAVAVCATAAPARAQALRSVQFSAQGSGTRVGDCSRDAERQAPRQAMRAIMRLEEVPAAAESCLVEQVLPTLKPKRAGDATMTGDGSCRVAMAATYARELVRRTSRGCVRAPVAAPVGVVLRAVNETGDGSATTDERIADSARAMTSEALRQANFNSVDLAEFQTDFLGLNGIYGECAITGAVDASDWRERCRTHFASPGEARTAIADKLKQALRRYSALEPWKRCHGLFVIGGVTVTNASGTVFATLNATYFVLSDEVTFIAPFSDTRPVMVDEGRGGQRQAETVAVGLVANTLATDAAQKLSAVVQERGCAAP